MKNDKIRIAVAGCGGRGYGMMQLLLDIDGVEVPCVADPIADRAKQAAEKASELQGKTVNYYLDHNDMFEKEQLDGVMISSSWATHSLIAVSAMKHGIRPAIECGGAASIDECWQLVRTSEATGIPCMFLENCCYGREEMTLLRMIKKGVFGELVHVQGGYEHDLRDEVAFGRENQHYRFNNYMNRCGELYPAHALGPMMKYLNINYKNRMVSLTSMASKAVGLHEYFLEKKGPAYDASSMHVAQGDVITTMIKCSHGETILLTHDTTLPRPYSRGARVQGTKGIYMEDKDAIYLEGLSPNHDAWETFSNYRDNPNYEHPLWTEFRTGGVKGGHGGMDYVVLSAFVDSIKRNIDPPLDVYDAAVLMAITPLSEASIASGSTPVAIPDFTDGKFIDRKEPPKSKYALHTVYEDLF